MLRNRRSEGFLDNLLVCNSVCLKTPPPVFRKLQIASFGMLSILQKFDEVEKNIFQKNYTQTKNLDFGSLKVDCSYRLQNC